MIREYYENNSNECLDDLLNWDVIKTENDYMDSLAARTCAILGEDRVYEEIEESNMSEKEKELSKEYYLRIKKYIKKIKT